MNISHDIQGDRNEHFESICTRRSLFKKCKHFRINFARKLTFLLKKFYAGNAHVMKADSKTELKF